jgi:hypothetical protein
MEIISLILLAIGSIIALVFGIQLLIIAFRTSIWWGLGSIFIPLVGLIFVILHWPQTKKPFLLSFLAIPCFIVSGLLAPATVR